MNRFVGQAVETFDETGLLGVINNAAVVSSGLLVTSPASSIDEMIRTNLVGAMNVSRAVARVLIRNDAGGRIINISSIASTMGLSGLAAYSASKAGVDAMTRVLARELGPKSITVNAVAPGYLPTKLVESLTVEQVNQVMRRTPLGRMARLEDVTSLVTFMLSEHAGFITGQTITVDGGFSV